MNAGFQAAILVWVVSSSEAGARPVPFTVPRAQNKASHVAGVYEYLLGEGVRRKSPRDGSVGKSGVLGITWKQVLLDWLVASFNGENMSETQLPFSVASGLRANKIPETNPMKDYQ